MKLFSNAQYRSAPLQNCTEYIVILKLYQLMHSSNDKHRLTNHSYNIPQSNEFIHKLYIFDTSPYCEPESNIYASLASVIS